MSCRYGWSIYIDRFGRLESLRGAGIKGLHVMDVISKIDQKNKTDGKAAYLDISGQLSFRKVRFVCAGAWVGGCVHPFLHARGFA
jgi:hypothetical protein